MLPVIRDGGCIGCGLHKTTERVCALSPPKRADLMIVGEAPGANEEKTGLLFNGSSGHLLWDALAKVGIKRDNVFVANAVNCRPPSNRTPKKGEIKACRHWLTDQIKIVKPKFILLLGNVPLISVTGAGGIKKRRGRPFVQDGIIYLATYHPAFILRDERNRPQFEADLRLLHTIVNKGEIPREKRLNFTVVDTMEKFEGMLKDLVGTVSFDTETTGLYQWASRDLLLEPNPVYPNRTRKVGIVSIGFGTRNRQWCWPINHPGGPEWFDLDTMIRRVTRQLKQCYLVGHNGKFDSLWVKVQFGVNWVVDFDTMLAHYICDENSRHDLKGLSQTFCGAPDYDEELSVKTGATGTIDQHCLYLAHDLYYTRRLRFIFGKLLDEDYGCNQVFEHILMPCARKFVEIEAHGVYIDVTKMDQAEKQLRGQLQSAEKELKKYGDINWRSPKQLAELFFGKLRLKPLDKTPSGAPSTNESVLLRLDHPAARALLNYRSADQLLKMFIDGWKPFLVDGRIHPSFKLHGTVTGRLSCEHPNLQQVPRDPIIRCLVTAPPGWTLIEIDLSQIEVRITAELSGDPTLLRIFDEDRDVHWATALSEIARGGGMKDEVISTASIAMKKKLSYAESIAVLEKIGPDQASLINKVWKEVRKKAKAVVFGYIFGMWWKKFLIYARDNYGLKLTESQAQESRKSFFSLYRELAPWHDRQRRYARRNGYVRSLAGRKRRVPEAMSPHDSPAKGEAERQAINSPVQSFANELNLMTLLQLIREFSWDVLRPIGTVHDAVLMEVREDMALKIGNRALKIMTHPQMLDLLGIKLRVPIKGEVKVGPWGKGVSLEEWAKK